MVRRNAVRAIAALASACLVLVLGSAYAWAAPSPAPGAPGGTGVTAWACEPGSTPSPTTSPALDEQGAPTVTATTVPSPYGLNCAATAYSDPLGPLVVASLPPGSGSGSSQELAWPSCSEGGLSAAGSSTPSPAPSPSALRTGTVAGRDCGLAVELGRRQSFALWLFLGGLLMVAVFAVVLRQGRAFRG